MMADDAIAGGAERRFAPTLLRQLCSTRHGSEALPRADSRRPLCSRGCEWRRRYSGGPHESAPSAARQFRHVWANTIQTGDLPELRTAARAFQCVELLAEREVLEDEFVMSAAGQPEPADAYKDHTQHASILSFCARRVNRRGLVLILANDRLSRCATEPTKNVDRSGVPLL